MKTFENKLIHALLLILMFIVGCNKTPQTIAATPLMTTTPPAAMQAGSAIKALGTIRPAQTLKLGFEASGAIKAVNVRLGKIVKAGDLLAELDISFMELDLQSAQEQVALQQAQLDKLLNGASAAAIERVENQHTQQVAEAEIALQLARLGLEQAQNQGYAPAITIIESDIAQLELQLAQARSASPVPEITIAQINLALAQDALKEAQIEYNKALDRPWEDQKIRDAHAKAIWLAEQQVKLSQARLDSAQNAQYAHELGIEALALEREVVASAQLAQTLDAQAAYSVTLELLATKVGLAERTLANLDKWQNPLLDPASTQDVAQARALLRQSELAVEQLTLQISSAKLYAPFDGIISAVYLQPKEWGAPGIPVLELMDTSRWYVETRNVGELVIGKIQAQQQATIQVYAFPGQSLVGRVDTISPVEVVQQGDTTYTLRIVLDPTELNLRPGMNAQVEILIE